MAHEIILSSPGTGGTLCFYSHFQFPYPIPIPIPIPSPSRLTICRANCFYLNFRGLSQPGPEAIQVRRLLKSLTATLLITSAYSYFARSLMSFPVPFLSDSQTNVSSVSLTRGSATTQLPSSKLVTVAVRGVRAGLAIYRGSLLFFIL